MGDSLTLTTIIDDESLNEQSVLITTYLQAKRGTNVRTLVLPKYAGDCQQLGVIIQKAECLVSLRCDAVTATRTHAFQDCNTLAEVNFPMCTDIGEGVFSGCTHLTDVTAPRCSTVGNGAFSGDNVLRSAVFKACTSIGHSAFNSCVGLNNVDFPVCTTIGSNAFGRCHCLKNVDFPVCTTIGSQAFSMCGLLESADFLMCNEISARTFVGCETLKTVNFPVCTTIDDSAFGRCHSLVSVVCLPDMVNHFLKDADGPVYVTILGEKKGISDWIATEIPQKKKLKKNYQRESVLAYFMAMNKINKPRIAAMPSANIVPALPRELVETVLASTFVHEHLYQFTRVAER